MSVLKNLNFAVVSAGAERDPKLVRRHKLIMQLQQQKDYAADVDYVVPRKKWVKQEDGTKLLLDAPKRVKRWWRNDSAGNCLFILRYGSKVLSREKGKAAIVVGARENLPMVIATVMQAVAAGELDAILDAVHKTGQKPRAKAA